VAVLLFKGGPPLEWFGPNDLRPRMHHRLVKQGEQLTSDNCRRPVGPCELQCPPGTPGFEFAVVVGQEQESSLVSLESFGHGTRKPARPAKSSLNNYTKSGPKRSRNFIEAGLLGNPLGPLVDQEDLINIFNENRIRGNIAQSLDAIVG